jgi:predicted RNA-binding Zn-ribbon protein involved in translation (DUF1610 family)
LPASTTESAPAIKNETVENPPVVLSSKRVRRKSRKKLEADGDLDIKIELEETPDTSTTGQTVQVGAAADDDVDDVMPFGDDDDTDEDYLPTAFDSKATSPVKTEAPALGSPRTRSVVQKMTATQKAQKLVLKSKQATKLGKRKEFECSECGLKLRNKSVLRTHKNTHLSVKPYQCKTCKTGFSSRTTYLLHLERNK